METQKVEAIIETTTETYVRYFYPGSFVDEEDVVRLHTADAKREAGIRFPANSYAYQIEKRRERTINLPNIKPIRDVISVEAGPKVFPGATIYSKEDLGAIGGDYRILISNMRSNGCDRVIKTRLGNFHDFIPGKTEIA